MTWGISSLGVAGKDRNLWQDIISEMSEMIDKFVNKYLRINANSC